MYICQDLVYWHWELSTFVLRMMSESLQDIKDELVADQSEMCSGAEFSEIQVGSDIYYVI